MQILKEYQFTKKILINQKEVKLSELKLELNNDDFVIFFVCFFDDEKVPKFYVSFIFLHQKNPVFSKPSKITISSFHTVNQLSYSETTYILQ